VSIVVNLLDAIQLFRRVAETQSFSAVAQERRIAQPTVSKMIAMLEAPLGVQLFRRSTRGLSLTAAGERLLYLGVPAVQRLEDVLALVRNEPLELTGELRVASNIAFARHAVVPTLGEFATMHPALRLNFVLHDGPANIVRDGINVAIAPRRVSRSLSDPLRYARE
jgi:LysR family transcriptional regulator for bpeEF and oprC